MNRKGITPALAILVILLMPMWPTTLSQRRPEVEIGSREGWRTLETDIVTIMFPMDGRHPMFLWWYTKDKSTVYVTAFRGLWEFYGADAFDRDHASRERFLHKLVLKITGKEQVDNILDAIDELEDDVEDAKEISEEFPSMAQNMRANSENIGRMLNIPEAVKNMVDRITLKAEVQTLSPKVEVLRRLLSGEDYQKLKAAADSVRASVDELVESAKSFREVASGLPEVTPGEAPSFIEYLENSASSVKTAAADVASSTGQLSDIAEELAEEHRTLKSQLGSIATKSEEIGSKAGSIVENIDSNVETLKELIKSLEDVSDISPATSKIDNALAKIEEAKGKVKSELEEIEKKMPPEAYERLRGSVEKALSKTDIAAASLENAKGRIGAMPLTSAPDLPSALEDAASSLTSSDRDLADAMQTLARVRGDVSDEASRVGKVVGEFMETVRSTWHPPFFSFFGYSRWEVTDVEDITSGEGDVIGLSFAFNLTKVDHPMFRFAENNVLIRCRFYFEPVEETVGETVYSISRAELKIDFVVLGWKWALDEVAELMRDKYETEINLENQSLALWVDLTTGTGENVEVVVEKGVEASMTEDLARDVGSDVSERARELAEKRSEILEKIEDALDEAEEGELEDVLEDIEDIEEEISKFLAEIAEMRMDWADMANKVKALRDQVAPKTLAELEEHVGGLIKAEGTLRSGLESLLEGLRSLSTLSEPSAIRGELEEIRSEFRQLEDEFISSTQGLAQEASSTARARSAEVRGNIVANRIRVEGRPDIDLDEIGEQEKPLEVGDERGRRVKLRFAAEDETLAGFFRFVSTALVTYEDGSEEEVPVKASYLEAGGF
ncbi:MAG: hypothetical protein ACE5OY_08415, partial [Candidatus Bathyarchaeia archaeon]